MSFPSHIASWPRLLGVKMPSVTSCLGLLEKEQSIRMERGVIRVSDPQKLEAQTSCHLPPQAILPLANRQIGARTVHRMNRTSAGRDLRYGERPNT